MKIKENKPIDQIPVPVVGMSSSHPSQFKLSSNGTISKKRKDVKNITVDDSIGVLKRWYWSGDSDYEYYDKDILDLKKLYFKGWLLSR